jgi:ubiquitin-activating enzyme E1 C
MLIGTDGIYSYTFEHEKRDDCPVCGGEALEMTISSEMTVEQLIETLVEKQDMCVYPLSFDFISSHVFSFSSQIKKPSLSTPTKQIYLQAPPQLEKSTRPNLEKKVSELVSHGGEVTVTATTLPFSLSLRISYST